jgi:TFIIF-interacting CTD phosphatase-like protein
LNRLGRSLKKTLIIDFDERIYATTPKNGFVSRWKGKIKDKCLLVISEIL